MDMLSYLMGRASGGAGPAPSGTLDIAANGTYDVRQYAAARVSVSETPTAEPDDVVFMDYDGTIRYSYSAAEFADLTALPDNPSHPELVAQGWNWDLEDAKEYVAKYGFLDVGQVYATASGATEIDIRLSEGRLSPYLGLGINGTVRIDWGDGSENTTAEGTSLTAVVSTQHVYSAPGAYTVKIYVESGSAAIIGSNRNASYLLWYQADDPMGGASLNTVYRSGILAVRIGPNMTVGSNGFGSCINLAYLTFTEGSVEGVAFCYGLKGIVLPKGATSAYLDLAAEGAQFERISIPKGLTEIKASYGATRRIAMQEGRTSFAWTGAFSSSKLSGVTVPDGIKTLNSSAFGTCTVLTWVTLPDSITTIQSNAMGYCKALATVDMTRLEAVPTLANKNAFSETPDDCVFLVKASLLENFQAATNWSTYADRFVGV